MPRYFLQLSFHGKKFHGWQIQQNAHSVQEELNSALSVLLNTSVETVGCGRTDTGVHARKFFAHFDSAEIENAGQFLYNLNCILPFEIAVQNIYSVGADAHARFDAIARSYWYYLHQHKNPFLQEISYYFPYKLDLHKLNEASGLLLLHNDFKCFSKTRSQVKTTLCKISKAEWETTEDQYIFKITADRFLRNMVRAIVGTLLNVGEQRMTIDEFEKLLVAGNRSDAGVSVPSHALFLTDVKYSFI